jgi:copper chaperone CopZ
METTLMIEGMTCEHCVRHVTKALNEISGVKALSVIVGQAKVAYDPALITPESIAAALKEAGALGVNVVPQQDA